MWRNILGVVAAIIAGSIAIMIVEGFSHFLYPYPEGLDFSDNEATSAFISSLPVAAKLLVALSWAIGSFVAAVVTSLIVKTRKLQLSLLDGVILMVFGIINMIVIPHPTWFWFVGIAVFIPFAWFGYYLLAREKEKT